MRAAVLVCWLCSTHGPALPASPTLAVWGGLGRCDLRADLSKQEGENVLVEGRTLSCLLLRTGFGEGLEVQDAGRTPG